MRMTRRIVLALGLAALGLPTAVLAGDEGLYEDVFDPQSSFVRLLAPGASFASIGGKRIEAFEGGLSDYVNVMPGMIKVTIAATSLDVEVAPARHYTVIATTEAPPKVVEDALTLSPAKADVVVYNLSTEEGIDLFVPQAMAVAIPDIAVQDEKAVALKAPLSLDFDLRAGGKILASLTGVELKRKSGVSIVLTGQSGTYDAVAVPNGYLR